MQKAMADGRATSRDIVQQSLTRIALYEDQLNAVIAVNPRALEEADAARPRARRGEGPRSAARHSDRTQGQHPHHEHADDRRRAGFRGADAALRGDHHEPAAQRRRRHHRQDADDRAGQLGDGRHARQLQQPDRLWIQSVRSAPGSARRRPPTDARRSATGGSSSGAGTATSFWAANVGTETSGSIINPSNQTMLVGIKPTVGRVSRYGIIPITADQDTAGPDGAHGGRRGDRCSARSRATRRDPNDPATGCVHAAASARLHAGFWIAAR